MNLKRLCESDQWCAAAEPTPKRARIDKESQQYHDGVPASDRYLLLQQCLPAQIFDGLSHVVEVLEDLLMPPLEAVVKAAGDGRLHWLQQLLNRSYSYAVEEAAVAAASHGHLHCVKLLYSDPYLQQARYRGDIRGEFCKVLDAAAARGFADVVAFVADQIARKTWHSQIITSNNSSSLSNAISGGHLDVVKVLFNPMIFRWSIGKATDQAVAAGQDAIVQLIHQLLRGYDAIANRSTDEKSLSLLVRVTRGEYTSSVKYVYDHGLWKAADVGNAFVMAATKGYADIVQFLYNTGNISTEMFNQAFVAAARSELIAVVKFLYEKHRASTNALNEAFVATRTVETSQLLYSSKCISNESIAQVFQPVRKRCGSDEKRLKIIQFLLDIEEIPREVTARAAVDAAGCGDHTLVKLLHRANCFPSEAIVDAFIAAAGKGFYGIIEIIGNETCISDDVATEAFTRAVSRGHERVVDWLLYHRQLPSEAVTNGFVLASKRKIARIPIMLYSYQKPPPEVIESVFGHAAWVGNFAVAHLLMSNPNVSQDAKNEALISVAQRGRSGALKFVSSCGNWSQDALMRALEVATNEKIKSALSKQIRA